MPPRMAYRHRLAERLGYAGSVLDLLRKFLPAAAVRLERGEDGGLTGHGTMDS